MLHIYEKDREQVRGVPWFAPVIINMRDLDEYAEAELVRKKIEACFAAFVTQPEGAEGPSIGPMRKEDREDVETVEPGMVRYLNAGRGSLIRNAELDPALATGISCATTRRASPRDSESPTSSSRAISQT